jgi:hypothetical protein
VRLGTSLVVLAGYVGGLTGAGQAAEGQPTLVVGVCDTSHVSPDVMRLAISETARIFRSAGVSTEWINRLNGSDVPVMMNVRIRPASPWNSHSPETLGMAFTERTHGLPTLADVYFDGIRETAVTDLERSRLLADVICHEVGHLLGLKHSMSGIMLGHWDRTDYLMVRSGGLRFSESDAKRLRAGLEARIVAQAADPHGMGSTGAAESARH